jgi:hypothetical protein
MRVLHAGSQKQIHLCRYRWPAWKTESNRGEDHGSLLPDYRNEVTVEVSQVPMQGLKSPPDQSFALFMHGRRFWTGEAKPDIDFSDLSRFQG